MCVPTSLLVCRVVCEADANNPVSYKCIKVLEGRDIQFVARFEGELCKCRTISEGHESPPPLTQLSLSLSLFLHTFIIQQVIFFLLQICANTCTTNSPSVFCSPLWWSFQPPFSILPTQHHLPSLPCLKANLLLDPPSRTVWISLSALSSSAYLLPISLIS